MQGTELMVFSTPYSSESCNFLITTLIHEIQQVGENNEFEYRDKSILLALLAISDYQDSDPRNTLRQF